MDDKEQEICVGDPRELRRNKRDAVKKDAVEQHYEKRIGQISESPQAIRRCPLREFLFSFLLTYEGFAPKAWPEEEGHEEYLEYHDDKCWHDGAKCLKYSNQLRHERMRSPYDAYEQEEANHCQGRTYELAKLSISYERPWPKERNFETHSSQHNRVVLQPEILKSNRQSFEGKDSTKNLNGIVNLEYCIKVLHQSNVELISDWVAIVCHVSDLEQSEEDKSKRRILERRGSGDANRPVVRVAIMVTWVVLFPMLALPLFITSSSKSPKSWEYQLQTARSRLNEI